MNPTPPLRSLAAIVFTDIVGYSAHVNRDDANAMRMVEEHFALVREIATPFGGKVIKTIGDSVHLEFASAQAATACSIAIQQAHQQRNTRVPEIQRFDVRIGVHTGDVEHRGGDIYGDGVNIAARLQPLAPIGGIAISDHVRNQLRLDLRNRFSSRGTPSLKNIDTPLELFVLEGDALAGIEVEVPAPQLAPEPARRAPVPPSTGPSRRSPILMAAVVVIALVAAAVALIPRLRSTIPGDIPDKSIAVLPFVDMSQAKDQEYFSDGIAEDLLNLLTKVQTLQVAARTSSFSFKDKDVAIHDIAAALRVAHLLQGSVRKAGNQVRITAQLVRAADGRQIWSQSWDRQMDDVFKVQDEIAIAVVEQLKVQLLGETPTAKPVDPRVYPLILQAHALMTQFTPEALARSASTYEEALAIAPNEARAWAGLGRTLVNQLVTGKLPVPEGSRRIREVANKALELDPANVVALTTLGFLASEIDLDIATAAPYYERARALEPGNEMVLNQVAVTLQLLNRPDEAMPIFEYRVAHDPASASVYANLANNLMVAKRWDDAIEQFRTALRLAPDYPTAHYSIGLALMMKDKDAAGALAEFEADPDEATRAQGRALVLYAMGRTQEADEALRAAVERFGANQPNAAATLYAQRGDADAAFQWLDKAVAARDYGLVEILTNPFFDSLHDDPRWLPLLRKLGRAPEQLAKIQIKGTVPEQASP